METRTYIKYTKEITNKIKEKVDSSWKTKDISQLLNIPIMSIEAIIRRKGWARPILWTPEKLDTLRELVANGKTDQEIAIILNIKSNQVANKRYELKLIKIIDWSEEKINTIKNLLKQNKTSKEIGLIVNINHKTIQNFLRRENLQRFVENNKYTPEQEKEVINLLKNSDLTLKEIARKTGVYTYCVSLIRTKNNIVSRIKHRVWSKDEEILIINQLNNNISIEEISKQINRSPLSIAIRIVKVLKFTTQYPQLKTIINHHNSRYTTLRRFLKTRACLSRGAAKTKGYEHNIDADFITNLYNTQDGKCAYSGIPMNYDTDSPFKASIDRVNSDRGYTKDNVKLTCWVVNQMKREHSEEFFLFLCNQITQNYKNNQIPIQSNNPPVESPAPSCIST